MKLNATLVALALALAGGAASAATVGTLYNGATGAAYANNPDLGPTVYAAFEHDGPAGVTATFDYVYNFQLDAKSDLLFTGNTYVGPTVSADSAAFTIYSGTSMGDSGTGAGLGSFSFVGKDISSTTFANLAKGSYFFEVMGTTSAPNGTAFNVTIQAPSDTGPLPAVPEPANMALMLGGLGLMGFMMKRRSRS
jgi:hypothetical protein